MGQFLGDRPVRRFSTKPRIGWLRSVAHIYHAFAKVELCPYQGHPSYWWGAFLGAMNWFVLSVGTIETIRRACYSKETCQRIFCALQLALLADLLLTCALVVPEERFTLAVYPVFMIFTASALVDVWCRPSVKITRMQPVPTV